MKCDICDIVEFQLICPYDLNICIECAKIRCNWDDENNKCDFICGVELYKEVKE